MKSDAAKLAVVGGSLLAAGALLGLWIFLGRGNDPFAVDVWWNAVVAESSSQVTLVFSYVMNFLGGGWFGAFAMPAEIIVVMVVLRRPWGALYFALSLGASALVVQLLKHTFGRARPEEIMVVSDYGSYPSGHVAHAATIAVAVWIVFPRRWLAIVGAGWVALMAFSRTYLHAHWLTDTVGGALVGAGAALLVAAAFAMLLRGEVERAAARAASLE